MSKVAIVTDSTSCLTEEMLQQYGIHTSYLMILFGAQAFQEFKELTPAKFVELSNAQKELPTTSQPSPGLTMELYESLLNDGFEEIIHITISGALSGSYASAVSAANLVNAEKIHVFDSQTVAFPQGALAIEAAKLANEGASVETIIARLKELQHNMHLSAAINDMTNLKKGGRISAISASLGSVLSIKPIIAVNGDGTLSAAGKVRTFKKAVQFLIDEVKNANLNPETDIVGVLNIENPEAAETLKTEIAKIYPGIEILEMPLSLVVSVHAGPGAAAVGWLKK